MAEGHDKKKKAAIKSGHDSIEITQITVSSEDETKPRQLKTNGESVSTEKAAEKKARIRPKQGSRKDTAVEMKDETMRTEHQQDEMSSEVNVRDNSLLMLDSSHRQDNHGVDEVLENSAGAKDNSIAKNAPPADSPASGRNTKLRELVNHDTTDFGPIIEYADEPLLPLFKACAPLVDIIHNISFYVGMALQETPEEPPDGLTIDESAAIRLYTIEWERPHRSLYSMLNYTLKNDDREHLRPYFKYMKLFITALVKLPCVPPLTVWRGVTKDLSQGFPPGTSVTWWAFSSATTELNVLENNMYLGNTGDRTLFSVEAINGRIVRAHSHFVTEDEILLLPGTRMIVQSQFSPAPNLHVIHLKQIVPEEVLLALPFEGILIRFNVSFQIDMIFLSLCALLYPKLT